MIVVVILLSMGILFGMSVFGKFVLGSSSGAEIYDGMTDIAKLTAADPLAGLKVIGILLLAGVGGAVLIFALDSFRRKLDDRWSGHG